MSVFEIIAIVAMVAFAIYKQTKVSEVTGPDRFKLPVIYAIVGVVVGGFAVPHGLGAVVLLAAGIGLSVVVGLLRGRLTLVWLADGRIYSRGTVVTIGLFLAMIVAKFGLGTVGYLANVDDGAGFGEVLVMIAVLLAMQAEIVWRRGRVLFGAPRRFTAVTV